MPGRNALNMADVYLSFINANKEILQLLSETDRFIYTPVRSGKILCNILFKIRIYHI